GSVLGLLPVIGVTFPFFSYGGSSLLVNAMLIGIVQSIHLRHRF
ncbi:MAG: FtsW/RodA/SpoVE family cell cycle protein, partial [bacterium]|nr:FtsW/RodA/SpoVE family cell cycle protein [bacterium]